MNLNNICLPSSSDVQAVGLPRKQSTTYHENVKSFLNSNQTSFVNLPSSIASHRLFEELYNLKNFSLPGCHTFPSSEDIFKWSVVLEGPTDTVYSNGIFFAELIFGVNYPFTAPEVIFRTKIYHCNINSQGQVCMGLVQNWKSIMGVVDVLKMLISLFYSCNPQNSLVPHIAEQYLHQFEEFEKMARIWTRRYAS